MRPPSEWRSYYLPLTSGCSNNTCTFCNYYNSKLQMRDLDEVKQEIDALSLYARSGIRLSNFPEIMYYIAQRWDGERLFLQDADALVYPLPRLKEVLSYLNVKLPFVQRIATYATAQDILRRTPDELKELRSLKLGIVYVGLETGDENLLGKIVKGVTAQQMIEASRKAKEADILVSISIILGLGGIEGSDSHVTGTARVLSEMDPEYVGALTLSIVPGTPLYKEWQQGDFQPISPVQSLQELRGIIKNAEFSNCFFSSMHASNYVAIRGNLPQEKKAMVAKLQQVIEGNTASLRQPRLRRNL